MARPELPSAKWPEQLSTPIPVAVLGLRRLLGDIVCRLIAEQPDLELVARAESEEELRSIVAAGRAAVAVIGAEDDGLSEFHRELLTRRGDLRIVQVAQDGGSAAVWVLRPHRTRCEELSRDGLVAAIRSATGLLEAGSEA